MLQLLNGIHSHASQYVDLVTYKFTNFQETDAGTYICVKTVVSDDKKYVTKSKIVINMEGTLFILGIVDLLYIKNFNFERPFFNDWVNLLYPPKNLFAFISVNA